MKYNIKRKLLACILALVMPLSFSGIPAFAADRANSEAKGAAVASAAAVASEDTGTVSSTDPTVVTPTDPTVVTPTDPTEATPADPTAADPQNPSTVASDGTTTTGTSKSTDVSQQKPAAGATDSGTIDAKSLLDAASKKSSEQTTEKTQETKNTTINAQTLLDTAAKKNVATTATPQSEPQATVTPQAVGDTFTATINVGGTDIPCVYKVLTENGTTGTVQVGDGTPNTWTINRNASGTLTVPATVSYNGVTYTVKAIGDFGFYGCKNITNVVWAPGSAVESTGLKSFAWCGALTDNGLATNTTITSLGTDTYFGCAKLVETGLATNKTITSLGEACFFDCIALTDTGLGTNTNITSLPKDCFGSDTGLLSTGLATNKTITSLGDSCFGSCRALPDTGLGTNSTVTSVGICCFYDSWLLADTGLATNTTLTSIPELCFSGDIGLENIAVGAGVTAYLDGGSFDGCSALKSVCFYGDYVKPSKSAFAGSGNPIVYYLSENTTWKGKTAADVASNASALTPLSKVSIVGGTATNTPTNPWASKAGSATEGRWAEGDTVQLKADNQNRSLTWTTTDSTGKFSDPSDPNATYTVGTSEGAETATITANYKYDVIFMDWDSTPDNVLSWQWVYYGGSATQPVLPVRAGYSFSGWDKPLTNITEDTVINAMYTANPYPVNYRVTGDMPAGYVQPVDTATYHVGDIVTVASVPTRDGYTFSGWTLNGQTVTSATMVEGGLVFEGVWTANPSVAPAGTTTTTTVPPAGPTTYTTPASDTAVEDSNTPVTAPTNNPIEELLGSDGTPLGAFDGQVCWVHWAMAIGLLATAAYGAVVLIRRRRYIRDLENFDLSVVGAPTAASSATATTTPATREV